MALRWVVAFACLLPLAAAFKMNATADQYKLEMNFDGVPPSHVEFNLKPNCRVSMRAYGASETGVPTDGYVELNGVVVWEAGWYSTKPNKRGVSLMTIDPVKCSILTPIQTFDTCADDAAAGRINAFLDAVPVGNVIVGVTGDEPQSKLGGSLTKLASYGVNVADIQYRSNFAFVAQQGFSAKTQFTKLTTSVAPFASSLVVNLFVGRTADDLKITLISKSP